ncbi:Glyoxylate reductase / Glyoxylate reductase / Hydroxypyruvate reductase, partial [hydrothermal vent metagenome]
MQAQENLMQKNKLQVGVTRKLPFTTEERLQALFDVQMNPDDTALNQEQLAALAANSDVLCPTVTDKIDAQVLAAGKGRLALIANFGAGTDHIDLVAAAKAGITVTNTPDVLTEDTADLAMALILAVPRRLIEGARCLRDGGYAVGWSPTWMMGRSLGGKKLGIIGMGRIGQALASRAKAFGMEVHYHNRKPVSSAIEESLSALFWPNLDDMLWEMDFVSLNCPLTDETTYLISAETLAKMSRNCILINTAR